MHHFILRGPDGNINSPWTLLKIGDICDYLLNALEIFWVVGTLRLYFVPSSYNIFLT